MRSPSFFSPFLSASVLCVAHLHAVFDCPRIRLLCRLRLVNGCCASVRSAPHCAGMHACREQWGRQPRGGRAQRSKHKGATAARGEDTTARCARGLTRARACFRFGCKAPACTPSCVSGATAGQCKQQCTRRRRAATSGLADHCSQRPLLPRQARERRTGPNSGRTMCRHAS